MGSTERVLAWLNLPLMRVGDAPITFLSLVYAVAALTLALLVSRLLRRGLDRLERRGTSLSHAAIYTLGRVVHYVLLLVGLLIALSMVGIDTGRMAIVAGALGVGLGFGLQAIFNNFVSGLIILFERSLKVGDFVELESGVHGEVQEINIRATRITTNDNIDIVVPNSEFVSGRVVNWTMREISRRVRVPFGVAYGSDKEMVKKAALEAAEEVPFTLSLDGPRRPQVWLTGFGDSSLDFELVVWLTAEATKRPAAVRAAYTWALESALSKYCLEVPFPQRDLHLRSAFGLSAEEALARFAPGKAPAGADSEEPPTISARERRKLAVNDAQGDVQRELDNALEAPEDLPLQDDPARPDGTRGD
jgi:small-conductance mechanosensitive channel